MLRQLTLSTSLLIAFVTLLISPDTLLSQHQYDTWYFGANAGISFKSGTAVPILDGQVNTLDGSAVISRPLTGDLLFYTDGKSVWDSSHAVMPVGTGLLGDESSGQPALIVPKPGDSNTFYIFTTGAANTSNTSTRYSVVDMQLNSGRGDVTEKNVMLVSRGTEKITATRHCNGRDYWVIAHEWGTNRFVTFLVTDAGISDTVFSAVGATYPTSAQTQGTFQISPNGLTLGVTTPALFLSEIFDFDNSNGVISNPRVIGQGDVRYYGQEFSPDNTKLYVNTLPQSSDPAFLYQFDLQAGSAAQIQASRFQLIELRNGSWQGGQLQAGPDGKIYIAWSSRGTLGVIEEPDRLGAACNYQHDGFSLGGRNCRYGLPNVIDSDLRDIPVVDGQLQLSTGVTPSTARSGDIVKISLIYCNSASSTLYNGQIDLMFDGKFIPISGSFPSVHVVDSIAAGECDTITFEARIAANATNGDRLSACFEGVLSGGSGCFLPDSACAILSVIQPPPVDTAIVDFTFYVPAACPGMTVDTYVLFNSRRFTDTIKTIRFEGVDPTLFEYGGPRPVQFVIQPTTTQQIPIRVKYRTSGPVSAIMILETVLGDTWKIRVRTDAKSTTTPFLNISDVRSGGHTTSYDTCVVVTSTQSVPIYVVDTAWVRGNIGAKLTSPAIPTAVGPGTPVTLCFNIANPTAGAADTLILGGSEFVEACPHCFSHTIIFDNRPPNQVSLSVDRFKEEEGVQVKLYPTPSSGMLSLDIYSEKEQDMNVDIIDLSGRLLRTASVDRIDAGRNVIPFDFTGLPSGTYIMRITCGERQTIRTFVLTR